MTPPQDRQMTSTWVGAMIGHFRQPPRGQAPEAKWATAWPHFGHGSTVDGAFFRPAI
jgi:hypothetical protein